MFHRLPLLAFTLLFTCASALGAGCTADTAPPAAQALGPSASQGHAVIGGAVLWTPGMPMGTAREHHTATLLADGRVLVAGGTSNAVETKTAEIYDPMAGTWTAAASMVSARTGLSSYCAFSIGLRR